MKRAHLIYSRMVPCLVLLGAAWGLTAPAQEAASSEADRTGSLRRLGRDDWSHHLRLGPMAGFNISADFKMSGTFGLSGSSVPGVYDDGYVLVDDTGNAGGLTANWGYNSASQASGSTLTLHRASDFSATDTAHRDSDFALGAELAYGQDYWKWGRTRIGWEFGFGWLPIKISDEQSTPASATQSSYLFDTFGIVMPTAPYRGSSVSAGAPVIDATPTAGSVETMTGTLTGTRELDLSLFTFKLGPSVHFDLGRNFGLRASGGPALGFVTGDYRYDELLIVGSGATPNQGKAEVSEVVFGAYVSAFLTYLIRSEGADVYLGVQYLPLGDASGSNQGREVNLNLGGQVNIVAGAHWTF